MPGHAKKCPHCGVVVEDWQAYCRNGDLVGFPNYRGADAERPELEKRALAAREDAQKRGLTALLAKLEALAEISQPVIAMGFSVCDDILRSDKYRNYHQCLKLDERNPAKAADHSVRVMVGERVFPIYAEHLIYAALSPDGRGLLVTVRSQYGGTSPPRILAGERRSSKKTRSLFSITMASACAALSYRGATERFGKSG